VRVFAEDVVRGKPDPECYLRAAELLAVLPDELIVVEDAPAGVAAGRAAGCRVLAVATTHPGAALAEADEIHGDLHELAGRLRS
jgi:mannitol-1-/sugar-/sorbitol-6-phosphatase